ncbi:MAG: flavodoxin family protein [Methanomassiliicoccales archaeon]|nr:MAG: flavodoxin family protein [Methanomassiliicoccales archaeon]
MIDEVFKMKVLTINGSPRKEGNTSRLLRLFTEEHAGLDLRWYDLVDMKIKDCVACLHCKTHDSCSIKDDMTKLYKDLKECDALVIGSPIYMGAETGIMKCMIDRMYALLAPVEGPKRYAPRLPQRKKALVLLTCGNPQPEATLGHQRDRFYSVMAMQGFSEVKVILVGGAMMNADIREKAEIPALVNEARSFLRD